MNLVDEMPPGLDDASASDALHLHWRPLPAPVYAQPACCCPPQPKGEIVVNAGCKVHGLKCSDLLRAPGSKVSYGLGR